jgi:hypothetical protein
MFLPCFHGPCLFNSPNAGLADGPDRIDHFRGAAGSGDRVLKGEKPARLPVQAADQVRGS